MRNVVLVISALVLGSTAASAQTTEWANKLFKGNTTHDFGSVPRGAQLYHRFPMQNPYAVKLDVINVRSSCGCVTYAPPTQTLEPRQSAWLDITMDARKFTGAKTVSVYVTVGPEYISTATLQVSANSRADVVFNPGEVNFGVVPRGQTPTQTIDVEYAGALDWRVSEVVKNSAPVDVNIEELYRKTGQVGYRLKVTPKADAAAGTFKWELNLKTNDPASPLVPVLVEATIQAPLDVFPKTVTLDTPKVGEAVTKRVVVRGTRPFKIVAVEGVGEGIEAELPATPAQVQTVVLKVQPAKAGELKRQLKIKTDLEATPPVSVSVEGTVMP